MTPIEQLEAEVAREEAELKKQLERTHAQWWELAGRLKVLKGQVESATSGGLDLKGLGERINGLDLPQWKDGPAQELADHARREAVAARRAAVADVQGRLPQFSASLSRLQYKISAEEGAVAQQVDLARAVAREVAQAARQLEAAGDEPLPIGRITKRQQPRVRMQVKIDFSSENNFYSGFSTNLSDGGVFIATVKLVPIGTHVDLFFRLPNGDGIECKGVVRWVREVNDAIPESMPGLGVQFLELTEAAKAAITAFVRQREPMFFPD